jgi:two-component system NtrC family sensor kinase
MQLLQVLADQAAVALENAHLYEEVQNQFVRLQQSQAQLIQVEKMAALGRLAASIAHEINNPLQSVRSCLTLVEEVLIGIQQNAQINRYLFIAGEEIERVAMIVSRMRDFYHPAQGIPQFDLPDSIEDIYYSIRGELREIDLHSVLESVLNLANKQLQQNEVEVRCSWTEDLPKLQGNLDYLKQVFLNLVLNAIDAMKATGGVLSINTTRSKFLLDYDAPQEAVCIEFRDSGVGMSPETQSRVFEPLFTTKEHGSGFGLYISYKIIEAHGGHIRVESDENLGTTIFITLPIIRPQETP